VLGMVELIDDVRLGRPEAARECEKLGGGEVLSPQHQHLRCEERLFDRAERRLGEGLREVDAARFGAEAWRQRHDPQRHGFSFGTSSHLRCFQLLRPSSASCTPFAPSSRFQRNGPPSTTCRRKSSHSALNAFS